MDEFIWNIQSPRDSFCQIQRSEKIITKGSDIYEVGYRSEPSLFISFFNEKLILFKAYRQVKKKLFEAYL